MSGRDTNDNGNSRHKKLKLCVENRSNSSEESAICVAGPSSAASPSSINETITSQMFKLNVDCFEHLFEWLSLDELLVFRRTCKRMKQVVDYYIKLNYPRSKLVHASLNPAQLWKCRNILDLFQLRFDCFNWIRHLYISHCTMVTADEADSIAYILNQLETLKLWGFEVDGDFYYIILIHCKQLKFLGVKTRHAKYIGIDNEWLLRTYPTLEQFEFQIIRTAELKMHSEPDECTEVLAFLQLNSNIRSFSTNAQFLWKLRRQILATNIQLDRLIVSYTNRNDLKSFCEFVNELYTQGFYERLRLCIRYGQIIPFSDAPHLNYIWQFHNLEILDLRSSFPFDMTIAESSSIEEIRVFHPILSHFLELMAKNFVKLKRVHMRNALNDQIKPFIRYAPQLEQIHIWMPCDLNFAELNEERGALARARKVTIYITEECFLTLKWTMGNSLNMDRIELKRIESCKLDHCFKWDSKSFAFQWLYD